MKKILIGLLIFLTLSTLAGCTFPDKPETTYTLTLSSELSTATLTRTPTGSLPEGTSVNINASNVSGYRFVYWFEIGTGTVFSTAQNHTFIITKDLNLRAVYEVGDPGLLDVRLESNVTGATLSLSPEGLVTLDTELTVIAQPLSGYTFDHWYDIDTMTIVSVDSTYSFVVTRNRNLRAVYLEEGQSGLYLFSNIAEAAVTQSGDGLYATGTEVIVDATAPENFTFVHWYDYYNAEIASTSPSFSVTLDDSKHLVAVYQYTEAVSLFYQTGFENTTKQAYEGGELTIDDRLWYFADALIGTSAADRKEGARSVRMRTESIDTLFHVPYLYEIRFLHANYGTDSSSTLFVEVSADGVSWIQLDSFTTTTTLTERTLTIQPDFYTLNNIDPAEGLMISIRKSGDQRVNIDNVRFDQQSIITPPLPQDLLKDSITFPNNSTRLQMTIDNLTEYYSYGDEWTGATCTVLDLVTEEQKTCLRYGEVNTNRLGEYQVVYYAIDDDGFTASQVFTKVVFRDASLLDYDYDDYYEGIEGLYGEALFLALRTIIQSGVTLQTYDAARQILEIADRDPNNADNVLLIYNRASVPGTWDAETWHREHVWPNSRLGIPRVSGSQRNIGTDLHNLRAINPSINSSRGNSLFDLVTGSTTWYPGEDRGDVARIYFYMATMWPHLVLSDTMPDPATTYEIEGAIHGYFSVLIGFHFDDPVDGFETNRNEIIFSYQNNRNPFIDYPHLVELIWFDHENIPLS